MTMLQLPNVYKDGTASTPVSRENDVSFQVVSLLQPPCYSAFFLNMPFHPQQYCIEAMWCLALI